MKINKHFIIGITFIFAFMLTIVPLPEWARLWRPQWVLMILLYWSIALPSTFWIFYGVLVGFIQDLISGNTLGLHGFNLSIFAYFAINYYHIIRISPIWQQTIIVFVLVLIQQLWLLWIFGMLNNPVSSNVIIYHLIYPSITSLLLWPWIFVLLRDLRRNFGIK
jgi:rod shape-determining protein MreD